MSKTLNKLIIVLYILTTLFAQLYAVSATAGIHSQQMQLSMSQNTASTDVNCSSSMAEDCYLTMMTENCLCCDIDCVSFQCATAYPTTSFDFYFPYRVSLDTSYECAALSQSTSLLYRPPIAL
ncbi:MAG: hypothetical protein V7784_12740 [Oceanospirillaceae bacterium]